MAILKHLPEYLPKWVEESPEQIFEMIGLVEQIGIDRTVLYEFVVRDIDTDTLQQTIAGFGLNADGRYVSVAYDKRSPVVLADGKHLSHLVVRDKSFGQLTVSFEQNNLNGRSYINAKLELMVSEDGNNLQNLTADQYKMRVADVIQLLRVGYGIDVDDSTISIKKIELNATFFLEEPYAEYQRAILLLIRNVPVKRYGGHGNNNAVKFATWYEATKETTNLETILVKNSSVELKIYNKGKHLKDLGLIGMTDRDIMRVEYTIKDNRILKNAFGDAFVDSLNDAKIKALFKKYFNRDVVEPYNQWAARNYEELVELVRKHRAANDRWTSFFFREVRQLEAVRGLPVLFDLEDLRKVFRQLESKSGRNAAKKFRNMKKQAIYETDLEGHTKRVHEILKKIMDM